MNMANEHDASQDPIREIRASVLSVNIVTRWNSNLSFKSSSLSLSSSSDNNIKSSATMEVIS